MAVSPQQLQDIVHVSVVDEGSQTFEQLISMVRTRHRVEISEADFREYVINPLIDQELIEENRYGEDWYFDDIS